MYINVILIDLEGHAWLQNPTKNFATGRAIFGDIVSANPTDYWALLLLGGCFTWDMKPTDGERYIRTALGIDK